MFLFERFGERRKLFPQIEVGPEINYGGGIVSTFKFKGVDLFFIGAGKESNAYAHVDPDSRTGTVYHIPKVRTKRGIIAIQNSYENAHSIFKQKVKECSHNIVRELQFIIDIQKPGINMTFEVNIRYQEKTYYLDDCYYTAPLVLGIPIRDTIERSEGIEAQLYICILKHCNRLAGLYAPRIKNYSLPINVIAKTEVDKSTDTVIIEIIFTDLF